MMLFVKQYPSIGKALMVVVFGLMLSGCSDVTFDWTEEGRRVWEESRPRILINNGAQFTNSPDVSLTFSGKNLQKMYVTNDPTCKAGGHWENFQLSKPWDLHNQQTNATATVYVQFQEQSGDLTECTHDSIVHDDIPPEVTINKTPDLLTNQAQGQFEFLAEDDGSGVDGFECSDDQNLSFRACSPPFEKSFPEGSRTFHVQAKDRAGNGSKPSKYEWTIDVTPPVFKLLKAPFRWVKANNAAFEFTASDLHGVDSFECSLDKEDNYQTCQSPFAPTVSKNQDHRIHLRALDSLGNKSVPVVHEWGVDQQGPDITFTKIPNGMKTHSQDFLAFTVKDDQSGNATIRCELNQREVPCNFSDNLEMKNLLADKQVFSISATDLLGNQSHLSAEWTVIPGYDSKKLAVPVAGLPPVDILFISDNSKSMQQEQMQLGDRFLDFVKSLEGLDWQIGITTTDLTHEDGRLVPFKGASNLFVIDVQMPLSTSDALFKATIFRPESGDSLERGIGAGRRAIERIDTDSLQRNAKLFRTSSHLAMVVLTDEDEWDDYDRRKPQQLKDLVTQRWGQKKGFEFHSIIARPGDKACICDLNYVDEKDCTGDSEHVEGESYYLLSQLTHGIVGDVCAKNYTGQLKSIGDSIQNKINRVELECAPIDKNYDGRIDLEITLNPTHHEPLKYTLTGTTLLFEKPLPPGDHTIEYFCFP